MPRAPFVMPRTAKKWKKRSESSQKFTYVRKVSTKVAKLRTAI